MLVTPSKFLAFFKPYFKDLLPKSPFTVTKGDGINQYSLGTDRVCTC